MSVWLRLHWPRVRATRCGASRAQPFASRLLDPGARHRARAAGARGGGAAQRERGDRGPRHRSARERLPGARRDRRGCARASSRRCKRHAEVASVRFVSRGQALDELKRHHAPGRDPRQPRPQPAARTPSRCARRAGRPRTARRPMRDVVGAAEGGPGDADFEWARAARAAGSASATGCSRCSPLLLAAAVAFIVGHLIRLQVVTRARGDRGEPADRRHRRRRPPPLPVPRAAAGAAWPAAVGRWAWPCGSRSGSAAELRALTPEYATELKVVFSRLQWKLSRSRGDRRRCWAWIGAWSRPRSASSGDFRPRAEERNSLPV